MSTHIAKKKRMSKHVCKHVSMFKHRSKHMSKHLHNHKPAPSKTVGRTQCRLNTCLNTCLISHVQTHFLSTCISTNPASRHLVFAIGQTQYRLNTCPNSCLINRWSKHKPEPSAPLSRYLRRPNTLPSVDDFSGSPPGSTITNRFQSFRKLWIFIWNSFDVWSSLTMIDCSSGARPSSMTVMRWQLRAGRRSLGQHSLGQDYLG